MAKQMKEKTGAYLYIPDEFRRMLWLEGIKILSDDKTKAAFNTPEALDLLTKYQAAAKDGIIPKDNWGQWDKMLQQYNTGKLAMINSGAQSINRVKDEAPNIYKNTEVTEAMVGKAGIINNSVMNLVVTQLSKHHTEAIDFAAFITNDDNQLAFSKTVSIFPSTTKASQDPYFKSDTSTIEKKAISIVADELPKTADMTLAVTKQLDIYGELKKAQESVTVHGADPKKALDEAEKKVNDLLAADK
jgi:putative chitobiose transport system substrate-binding protein